MKLCTFRPAGAVQTRQRLGVVSIRRPDQVIDLAAAFSYLAVSRGTDREEPGETPSYLRSMQELLQGGMPAQAAVRGLLEEVDALEDPASDAPGAEASGAYRHAIDAITLLAPLPRPLSIRDCMAFEGHLLQATRGGAAMLYPPVARLDALLRRVGLPLIRVPKLYHEIPAYYKGNPASVIGHDAEVTWPDYTERLDYELEIGFYIHKAGRDIGADEAGDYIAGYTIFNDFSARDVQLREMNLRLGPAKGKDFDTGNAMGPWLVTPDEAGDPTALRAIARVNGQVWTDGSTRNPAYAPEELISYISQSETLYPGDFIGMGTVPNGCGLELGRWLRPGDVVEIEVERLGTLRNRVMRG